MDIRNLILQIFLVISFCSHICDQFKVLKFLLKHLKIEKDCYCRCGGISNTQRMPRLLDGIETYPSEFPWVAIIKTDEELLTTGSLINDRYVLTGASQIYRIPQINLSITLNKFDLYEEEKQELTVGALNVIFHPGFNSHLNVHDLALIRLRTSVEFHFPLVPICLPRPGVSYNGRLVVVTNFNTDRLEDSSSLHKLELPILPKKRCSKNIYEYEDCLGILNSSFRSQFLCMNDSGAGVQYENPGGYYELVGVMTSKQSCTVWQISRSTSPIPIMTTVQHYLGWILENTKDACYCAKY